MNRKIIININDITRRCQEKYGNDVPVIIGKMALVGISPGYAPPKISGVFIEFANADEITATCYNGEKSTGGIRAKADESDTWHFYPIGVGEAKPWPDEGNPG